MKTKIPQHKLHSDRITQKWVILCCGTKGLSKTVMKNMGGSSEKVKMELGTQK
jgi:hypothetical protein